VIPLSSFPLVFSGQLSNWLLTIINLWTGTISLFFPRGYLTYLLQCFPPLSIVSKTPRWVPRQSGRQRAFGKTWLSRTSRNDTHLCRTPYSFFVLCPWKRVPVLLSSPGNIQARIFARSDTFVVSYFVTLPGRHVRRRSFLHRAGASSRGGGLKE